MLEIKNLEVEVAGKAILKGVSLCVGPGEIHAIMGPNGAGKSTLAKVLAGAPEYETRGEVLFEGVDILSLDPEERARKGMFLGFQYPVELPGVSNRQFLEAAWNAICLARGLPQCRGEEFLRYLEEKMALLDMRAEFQDRNVNEGFSGGEKKRNEILQMAVLDPKLAILDETDSGLDIDAMRIVAKGVHTLHREDKALVLITHYQRLLEYIQPNYVHVLIDGRIVQTGGPDLARMLEKDGYDLISSPGQGCERV